MFILWRAPNKKNRIKNKALPAELFKHCIEELIKNADNSKLNRDRYPKCVKILCDFLFPIDHWVNFEDNESKGWEQVAIKKEKLQINIFYPFDDYDVFTNLKISIPSSWELSCLKKRRSLTFETSEKDCAVLANFINMCFLKLYGCSDTYRAEAVFSF